MTVRSRTTIKRCADANDADAFDGRGLAYANKGDDDRAIRDYDQAIRLNAKQVNAFRNRPEPGIRA